MWGYIVATPFLGKVLFVHLPRCGDRHSDLVLASGHQGRVPDDARGDHPGHLQRHLLDPVRAGGSSLTLFADRNTTLELFGIFVISAPQTQNFNPITIVIFAPIMSWLWVALAKKGLGAVDPGQVRDRAAARRRSASWFSPGAASTANADFRVALWWLVLTYFLHSIAELCISPVGLSMITKLSIARVVGMMMGVWFLSISIGEYLAGAAPRRRRCRPSAARSPTHSSRSQTYSHTFMTGGEIDDGRRRDPAGDFALAAQKADARCQISAWRRCRSPHSSHFPAARRSRTSPSPRRRSSSTRTRIPSTYVRYPGVLTVIRHATVFDGEGRRYRQRHRRLRRRRRAGGRRARARQPRGCARDRRHRQMGHARASSTSTATSAIIRRPESTPIPTATKRHRRSGRKSGPSTASGRRTRASAAR